MFVEMMEDKNMMLIFQISIAVVVVLVTLLAWIIKKKFKKGDTILIVGLCDAGKTVLFRKLICKDSNTETYTSLQENKCNGVNTSDGKCVTLIDFPGSDKLRKQLFSKYLQKGRKTLKGIVFVIDSVTFSKKSRDAAAFLYDVLYESQRKVPILVACNKQDYSLAKSPQAIRTTLEREFGFINSTREAALESTDGQIEKRTLTNTGKNFQWSDLSSSRIDFVECNAKTGEENDLKNHDIEAVSNWITAL